MPFGPANTVDIRWAHEIPQNQYICHKQLNFEQEMFRTDSSLLIQPITRGLKLISINIIQRNDRTIVTTLEPISRLGEGSYGVVFLYGSTEFKLAIKVPKTLEESESELNITEKLTGTHCHVIQCRAFGVNNQTGGQHWCYAMPPMDGTLDEFAKGRIAHVMDQTKRRILVLQIIEQIRQQLVCLQHEGFLYTDCKVQNVLFRQNGHRLHIMLADLGSATVDEQNTYGFTYPPPELHLGSPGRVHRQHVAEHPHHSLAWGLGNILLQLMYASDKSDRSFINMMHVFSFHSPLTEGVGADTLHTWRRNYRAKLHEWLNGAHTVGRYGKPIANLMHPEPRCRTHISERII